MTATSDHDAETAVQDRVSTDVSTRVTATSDHDDVLPPKETP